MTTTDPDRTGPAYLLRESVRLTREALDRGAPWDASCEDPGDEPDGETPGRDPYLDGCPNCVVALNAPLSVQDAGSGVRADYRCHRCGHVWFTGWQRHEGRV